MTQYPDHLKARDALKIYFSKYHFANGGYELRWFKLKVGFLYIPLPNTKGRVQAVKLHDLHHLITGYEANLKGEAEIGAWEIAGGCGKYSIAWILNAASFFYGMFFFPAALYQAFLNGRRCRSNFYHQTVYNDVLLNKPLAGLKEQCGFNAQKNKVKDHLLFFFIYLVILSLTFCVLLFFYCISF